MSTFDSRLCGARIKMLRNGAKMKQAELGKALDAKGEPASVQSISSYERGKSSPSLATLVALSDIFHVTVDYLIGISDDPNPFAAEVSQYTGISPAAAKVLKELLIGQGGQKSSISVLNDLILNQNFQIALFSMSLLRRRKDDMANAVTEAFTNNIDVIKMRNTHAAERHKYLSKEFGMFHVLTGIDVIHYEADQALKHLKAAVASVCEIRQAEQIWQEKSKEARWGKPKKRGDSNGKESE